MVFNDDAKKKAQADLEEMKKLEEAAKKKKMYTMIGQGVAGLILLLILFRVFRKKKKDEIQELPENNVDLLIGDVIEKQPIAYEPVLEDIEQDMTLEKEIKSYATNKPDQVVELIKTWLSEDER